MSRGLPEDLEVEGQRKLPDMYIRDPSGVQVSINVTQSDVETYHYAFRR